jgi:hypothetical protein
MLNDRGVTSMLAFAALLLSGSLVVLDAQRTGVLSTPAQDTSAEARRLSADQERRANHAVLLYDPGLASAMRSSANGLNLVFFDSLREGRIQLNLCDLNAFNWAFNCREDSFLVMLAGPLNDKKATDLLSFDGLVGDARLEVAWTDNIVDTLKRKVTISAVAAYPEFSFRSASSLAEETQRDVSYRIQLGGSLRRRWRQYLWSVLASYAYERNFDEQDEQTVCTPASFGPSGTTVCSDIVVGAPTGVSAHNLLVEGKIAMAGAYAIGAAWKHDITQHTDVLDIPVYFLTATTDGLAGGCRIGFRTGERNPSFTFFVNVFKL